MRTKAAPREPINLAQYVDYPFEHLKGKRNNTGYRTLRIRGREIPKHRLVLFKKIGPGSHACHWCGKTVSWERLHLNDPENALIADHVDQDKENNHESNIVPSCNTCNSTRNPEHHSELLTFNGRTLMRCEWASELGITSTALLSRFNRWSLDDALTRKRWAVKPSLSSVTA